MTDLTAVPEPFLDFAIAKPGEHFKSVDEGSLPHSDAFYALSGMREAGLESFLKQHPLGHIQFAQSVADTEGRAASGSYNRTTRDLILSRSIPIGGLGKPFVAGESYAVADAGRNEADYLKGVFVHEVGHHVLNVGGMPAWEIVYKAYAEGRSITALAGFESEYFSESLSAYAFYPDALLQFDPIGYAMVVKVLRLVGAKEGGHGS